MNKCIIITHHHSFDTPGGGTKSCIKIAHQLKQLGVDVILVPISSSPNGGLKTNSIPVIPVALNSVHYLLTSFSVAKTIKQLLATRKVDAVFGWDYEAAFLPKIVRSHGVIFGIFAASSSYEAWISRQTAMPILKKITDNLFRWKPLKQAETVFVASKFMQSELINLFDIDPNRIVITHRGIDSEFGQVKREQSDEISNFIFYGNFSPHKGVFDLIEALGIVATQGYRNWKLKIAGWGNEELVKQALHKHGIEEQVILLGLLDNKALARELEWANLAILPSRAESFGRAIAEAQASGLPVISYDAGSVPEVINEGTTGWLAPLSRTDLLAEAIIEAIQNPKHTFQMGISGRERMSQLFSWEKTTEMVLKGIQKAKEGKKKMNN